MPAAVYLAIAGGDAAQGWAIPTATDIAFALAVLAVAGRFLPSAPRTFLLTLAVVDDLIAIVIIAAFYTTSLSVPLLLCAAVPLAVFAVLVQRRVRAWWLLLPLAFATWTLVHASGVHATVAGVLLALTVPVLPWTRTGKPDPGLAEHFEHRFRPLSASVAVPVFAFLSAGVAVGGLGGLAGTLTDPVAMGIVAGLLIGKPVGVLAATWLVARFTRATLNEGLSWADVAGLAVLAGIGFTVSLLIGELAFAGDSAAQDGVKVAVLAGSLASAAVAAVILRLRAGVHRRVTRRDGSGPDRAIR
ncbi:hypothetical protein GCM10009677_48590 [Sphaerisporangium rubeum]